MLLYCRILSLGKKEDLERYEREYLTRVEQEKKFTKVEKLKSDIEQGKKPLRLIVYGRSYFDVIAFIILLIPDEKVIEKHYYERGYEISQKKHKCLMYEKSDVGSDIKHLHEIFNPFEGENLLSKILMLDKKTDNVEVMPTSKEKEVNYSKDPYNFPFVCKRTDVNVHNQNLREMYGGDFLRRYDPRNTKTHDGLYEEDVDEQVRVSQEVAHLGTVFENYIKFKENICEAEIILHPDNFVSTGLKLFKTDEEIQEEKERAKKRELEEEQVKIDLADYKLNAPLLKDPKNSDNKLKKRFHFDTGLEVILEIQFSSQQKVKTRLFLSKDNRDEIYSRDFYEHTDTNFLHFQIEIARKGENTRWNYEGDKEIGDNFESGYTLTTTMTWNDSKLRRYLVEKLNEMKFGSLPSGRTIHSHKDSKLPTKHDAQKILEEITSSLFNEDYPTK